MDEHEHSNGDESDFEVEDFTGDEYESGSTSNEEPDCQEVSHNDIQEEVSIPASSRSIRGVTRLAKLHEKLSDSKSTKHVIQFDELGRFTGEYRTEIASFLGVLVRKDVGLRHLRWKQVSKELKDKLWEKVKRFYDIEEKRKELVLFHLGEALRNFRAKLYKNFIKPNISKASRLKVVPKQYNGVIEQKDWNEFVKDRLSDKFQGVSKSAQNARAKHKYPHKMGRAGYEGLKAQMVKNNELAEGEIPSRSLLWRKARENKNGDYDNDELRDVATKIVEYEKGIQDGSLKVDHCTDGLTMAFGREHNGRVIGAGKGVTPTKYWNIPMHRGSSKEKIVQLEATLNEERSARHDLQVALNEERSARNDLQDAFKEERSARNDLQEDVNRISTFLSSMGVELPKLKTVRNTNPKGEKSLKGGLLASKGTIASGTRCHPSKESCMPPSETISTQMLTNEDSSLTTKCRLTYSDTRNIVAHGTIFYSSVEQTVHGVPLRNDCYRVSVDKAIKAAAFLPIQAGEQKTVGEACGSFVAWPKKLVIPETKVLQATPDLKEKQQSFKKRSRNYTTLDQMQKVSKYANGSINKK